MSKNDDWKFDSPLEGTIMELMPQFVLHIDPIVHSGRFRGMKISDNQIKVIMLLHHAGKVSPGFVSKHLNIQKGSLTAILKGLRRIGLIFREDAEDDERSYRVSLTDLGRDFARQHEIDCDRELGELLRGMEEKDRDEAKKGLDALIRHLKSRGRER